MLSEAAYAFKQRIRNPIGNNGSVRQSNREGDNTKSTSTGVYAINIPSGFLIFISIHFKVIPKFKLAPAESPIKEKLNSAICVHIHIYYKADKTIKLYFTSYQQEVSFALYSQARYLHDLKPMHMHITLLQVHGEMELQVLNCNLCLRWEYQGLWPRRLSTFHEIVKFALQSLHHENELSVHRTIQRVLPLLHLNQPERSIYCTGVKPMFHKNCYLIKRNAEDGNYD